MIVRRYNFSARKVEGESLLVVGWIDDKVITVNEYGCLENWQYIDVRVIDDGHHPEAHNKFSQIALYNKDPSSE